MPALIVALLCSAALVLLGDLRQSTWLAIALLVGWGVIGSLVFWLDLRRLKQRGEGAWGGLDVRRLSPGRVLLAALLVRLVLLASPPTLSDDLYRYIWEGWLTWQGGNPYATPPAGDFSALDHPVRLLVNHPEVSTIYPPLTMWVFAALAAISPFGVGAKVLVFKAAMGLADAGVAAALAGGLRARGRSTAGAWLYAVLPLGAVESAGSGHMEALGLLCLALALWDAKRPQGGLGWASVGALLKLLPGALIPSLWRRRPWILLVAAVLAVGTALPFRAAGPDLLRGFSTYTQHWSFNASGFLLLSWILPLEPTTVRAVAVLIGVLVSVAAWWRLRDPARVALWIGGAFVLLSPTVHPWYLLWVWVPALVCGVRSWTVLVVLAPLSYAALASYDPLTSTWEEPAWPVWAQYLPLAAAAIMESLWHLIRPGPWAASRVKLPPSSQG